LDGDQPVARPLPTLRPIQTQNKLIQTSIPRVGFEPTIPVLARAKTVHALNYAATVTGWDRKQFTPKVFSYARYAYSFFLFFF
jgi:hypothetical protein